MSWKFRPRLIMDCTLAQAEGGGLTGEGRLFDRSLPGWSGGGLKHLSPGDFLQLHLRIPDLRCSVSVPLATVRWVQGSRMGVQIILMDADDRHQVRQLFHQALTLDGLVLNHDEEIVITAAE